jgi:hypothetical protein
VKSHLSIGRVLQKLAFSVADTPRPMGRHGRVLACVPPWERVIGDPRSLLRWRPPTAASSLPGAPPSPPLLPSPRVGSSDAASPAVPRLPVELRLLSPSSSSTLATSTRAIALAARHSRATQPSRLHVVVCPHSSRIAVAANVTALAHAFAPRSDDATASAATVVALGLATKRLLDALIAAVNRGGAGGGYGSLAQGVLVGEVNVMDELPQVGAPVCRGA